MNKNQKATAQQICERAFNAGWSWAAAIYEGARAGANGDPKIFEKLSIWLVSGFELKELAH